MNYDEIKDYYLIRFLIVTGILGSIVSFFLSIYLWHHNAYFSAVYQFLGSLGPSIIYLSYRKHKDIKKTTNYFSYLLVYIAVYFIFFSSFDVKNLILLQVLPVAIYFIMERKRATQVIVFLGVLMILLIIIKLLFEENLNYDIGTLITALVTFIFISSLLFLHTLRYEQSIKSIQEKDIFIMSQSRTALLGEMLSMIAHQWRQPLTAITTTIGIIQMKMSLQQYEEEYFQEQLVKMVDYAQHLSGTIDDFRNFFKLDNEASSFKVTKVIKRALKLSESMLHGANIVVEKSFQTEKSIMSFENGLIQVLMNIIQNAHDVLMENKIKDPKIWITTKEDDEAIVITINDNGGGIPSDVLPKIFDPYFSTKSKNEAGLGLYMSEKIITEHCKGELSVTNTKDGTCFTITLPMKTQ